MGAMPLAWGTHAPANAASDGRRPSVRGLLRPADAIHGFTRGVGHPWPTAPQPPDRRAPHLN